MVQDRAIYLPTNRKSHMVYRMAPFSLTLNDPNPDFKVTPLFNAEYFRNSTTNSNSEILTGTYVLVKDFISNDLE